MKIGHLALWVNDLEGIRSFYIRFFGALSGKKYTNSKKGFESYFLEFDGDVKLEIMRSAEMAADPKAVEGTENQNGSVPKRYGYAHLALVVESEAEVDRLTRELAENGVTVLSGPRRTGDGYYESAVADPEGNCIEITA